MAASGGHWQKVSSGSLEGKRIFVPKDVSSWAVVAAKEEGMTYSQYQASFKKAKKANEADIENFQAGIAQNAPAPKAFAKPEPGSLVDMFGTAIPAAKAPAGKISKAASKSLDPINKMAAASGSKKFDVINQDTVKLKTEVFKPMKTPKKEYGAWKLAADAAIRVSVYHGQPTFVYKVEGKDFTYGVKFANQFNVNLIPAGSKFTLFAAKPSGSATFETIVTNYQG